ncbi:MAG: HAD family hydrolase [Balneolaceae bacterium]
MIDCSQYKQMIFDVDGVIFDSNALKADNIRSAAAEFVSRQEAEKFTEWFTGLNGIPREIKVHKWFADKRTAEGILESYTRRNEETLYEVAFTAGARQLLETASKSHELIALSGGEVGEVRTLFERRGIRSYFREVLGGPKTKQENLAPVTLHHPLLYVGDSRIDYECAAEIGADFVFMAAYTQFFGWQSYFAGETGVRIIQTLEELRP